MEFDARRCFLLCCLSSIMPLLVLYRAATALRLSDVVFSRQTQRRNSSPSNSGSQRVNERGIERLVQTRGIAPINPRPFLSLPFALLLTNAPNNARSVMQHTFRILQRVPSPFDRAYHVVR